MNVEIVTKLRGRMLDSWKSLLLDSGLSVSDTPEKIALVLDDSELIATASRTGDLIKYIAVKADRQGEDLTAAAISALRSNAFAEGHDHLFLYTKPENEKIFTSLFFYSVASTDRVLLMENRKNGICDFISSLKSEEHTGRIGALVMNCNPFTLGHQYLVERAASECDHVYVFVLSEDKSFFTASDRMKMVRLGTAHLKNVTVLPTGPYLISSATFPAYFLKEQDDPGEIQCLLDIEIFIKHFAPAFSITERYVGTEPLSPVTEKYNRALAENLPKHNVRLVQIERKTTDGVPISASAVRELIVKGNADKLKAFLPKTTIEYLKKQKII